MMDHHPAAPRADDQARTMPARPPDERIIAFSSVGIGRQQAFRPPLIDPDS